MHYYMCDVHRTALDSAQQISKSFGINDDHELVKLYDRNRYVANDWTFVVDGKIWKGSKGCNILN
jgi:hypothetical protein